MTYQLEKQVAERLKAFFEPFDFIDKVVIFGSRAKHNANPKSDIDLCIYSLEMSDAQFSKLKLSLDELPILYKIDVVHFEKSNEALRENVSRDGKLLFKKYSSINEITINLDNLRKPINKLQRTKIKEGILYPYFGANGVVDYINTFVYNKKLLCIAEDGGAWGYKENCAYIIDEKCSVNNHAHVLEMIENKVDIDYLKYFLNITDLNFLITGTTRGKLTKTALNSIQVYLPSLTKQKEIAQTLDKASELIELRKASIQKLDELAQSIFIDMFGDPVENPKGWKTKTIEEIVKNEKYAIKRGPFGGSLKKEIFVKEGYLVYEQFHALNNDFSMERYFINDKKFKELKAFEVKSGDIIISCSGIYLGKLAIVPPNSKKGIINQALLKVSLDEEEMKNILFIYIFTNNNFKSKFFGNKIGSGIPNFPPMDDFKKFRFITPPIAMQKQFAKTIEKIESQKSLYEAELTQFQSIFDALMAQSFEG